MTVTEKTITTAPEVQVIVATPAAPAAVAAPVVAVKTVTKPAVKRVAKKPVVASPAAVAAPVATKVTAKPAVQAAAKPAAKAAAKAAVKATPMLAAKPAPKLAAKPVAKPKVEKLLKAKKPKLVRDSFTIPKAEYTVLEDLKQRAGKLASSVKKSELIRAGVKALAAMTDAAFVAALKAVPTIKTGRPTTVKAD